jgi:class 3 adenylate cyclase/tetratricopeptide (TPR) repeat protein
VTPEPVPKELSFDEKLDKIQRYLPKGLTKKILSQRDRIEGERKQVTVMFCDMEGFTSLSESLGPEEAYGVMDQVYEILIHKVHDYEGTVNEMTGDGVMALFGAPIALEDAPQRAIRSAYSIHREMVKFSEGIKREEGGIPPIKMRIGIHTGPVVVGTLGNNLRVEFKAVGDTVNLASRMEGLAEPGATYVTEEIFRLTEGFFQFESLGEKQVKGKEQLVQVYRVITPSARRTRFDVSAYRGLTPFVGRHRELELLLDGLDRAKGGRGQAFSITAEAGAGKSRLLYEFRKAVTNEDATFLEGKCLSYSRGVAYDLHIDVLKSNFDIREGERDSKIREKVKRGLKILRVDEASTLPYLLELLSVKDSGIDEIPLSPDTRRDRIIEALKLIVLKGSEIRPLILAYEDLHWVDKSSEDVLKNLLESIPGARVLLIFTYRPEFVHTWGGRTYHSQVNLSRLSNRESLAMVSHLLGTDKLERGLGDFILEKTEGIPFFIEELIKSLRDLQIIERKDNTYRIAKDIQTLTIPATIQDVIMARVDSLPESVKNVLQTGSVVGREFSHDLISKVTVLPEQELLSHLSVLKDSELVYERGIYPQSTYIFKHALTQEVTYESLLLKKRKEMHKRIGEAMEESYPDRLEEFCEILAYHYSTSEDTNKAYRYLKLSGDKSMRNYSTWEAYRSYREAITVLKHLPTTAQNKREQLEVRRAISNPMVLLGYPEGSLEILQEAERLAEEIGDEKSLSIAFNNLALYYLTTGKPLLGIKYTEGPFREAEKAQDIDLMAPLACQLCFAYLTTGQHSKLVDAASKVIARLEQTHRERDFFGIRFNVYSGLSALCIFSHGMLGNFEKGKALYEKGLYFAQEANSVYALGVMEVYYGHFLNFVEDGKAAMGHLRKAIGYFEKAQASLGLGFAWAGLGHAYSLTGDPESGQKYIEKAIKFETEKGIRLFVSLHHLSLSMTHFMSENFQDAEDSANDTLTASRNYDQKGFEGISLIWLGRILGQTETASGGNAEEHIVKGIRICDELSLKPWSAKGYLFLGELHADRGKEEKAVENLKKAEGMFQEMGMDYWLAKIQDILDRL